MAPALDVRAGQDATRMGENAERVIVQGSQSTTRAEVTRDDVQDGNVDGFRVSGHPFIADLGEDSKAVLDHFA